MTPKENDLHEALLAFLKEDVTAAKVVAQSAMDIARDNKESTAVLKVHLEGINSKFDGFQKSLNDLVTTAKESFVPRAEFDPVKKIVFGAVAIILTEFLGMIIYLIGWKI